MSDQTPTPPEVHDMTPAEAYRIGYEAGRVAGHLDSISRKLDDHLLNLGVTREEIDAAVEEARPRAATTAKEN